MDENPFDALQKNMVDVVKATFGYNGSWLPSAGDPGDDPLTARVLFKEPSANKDELDKVMYHDIDYFMEYFEGDFPGLNESVRAGADETVIIMSTSYFIRQIKKSYDGKTYKCLMEKQA